MFHDFPDDAARWKKRDHFLLGPDLLVAPVVEPGVAVRSVRLPAGADWRCEWTGAVHPGGTTIELEARWDRPPHLRRHAKLSGD